MQIYELTELQQQQLASRKHYLEFLKVPDLSMGLYVLAAGSVDTQKPHSEDEVYYVTQGHGMMRVGDEDRRVGPGSIVYVPALLEHRFHSITADLHLLVFFAPAETSQADVIPT